MLSYGSVLAVASLGSIAVALGLGTAPAVAGDKIWVGVFNSNFANSANWIGSAATAVDAAVFDPTAGGTNLSSALEYGD